MAWAYKRPETPPSRVGDCGPGYCSGCGDCGTIPALGTIPSDDRLYNTYQNSCTGTEFAHQRHLDRGNPAVRLGDIAAITDQDLGAYSDQLTYSTSIPDRNRGAQCNAFTNTHVPANQDSPGHHDTRAKHGCAWNHLFSRADGYSNSTAHQDADGHSDVGADCYGYTAATNKHTQANS